jgi:signal transduction histidine kinase
MADRRVSSLALAEALHRATSGAGELDRDAMAAALDQLLADTGARGISIELDAPPLPQVRIAAGALTDGRSPSGASADDDLERRAILADAGASGSAVVVLGDAASRARAHELVELALEIAWWRQAGEAARGRFEALDDATRALAGDLELEPVLQHIVDHIRPLVGARYAALATVGPDGWFDRFITSGMSDQERARIGHIPVGLGLLGLVVHVGRAIRIPDIERDPRRYGFPPDHPPMHSFLGVPIVVMGVSVGNLYLTEKLGNPEFTADDERLVETFARHAGIAIDRARLHGEVQRIAVVEERERIARDLHDGIIQSLYGVTLSLDDLPELVDEDRAAALAKVERAIDAIHATIRDIREFILGLRAEPTETGELAEALAALAEEARRHGVDQAYLEVSDDARVSTLVATELLHIAREAVSNVVRHSGASRLRIALRVEGEHLTLAIEDDGHGFDPAASPGPGHHGLENLRARARRLRGELSIESTPGWGTRVTVML